MTGEQMVLRDRDETRMRIAETLRGEIERQPMTLIADDVKILLLSEIVLRIAEGRA